MQLSQVILSQIHDALSHWDLKLEAELGKQYYKVGF